MLSKTCVYLKYSPFANLIYVHLAFPADNFDRHDTNAHIWGPFSSSPSILKLAHLSQVQQLLYCMWSLSLRSVVLSIHTEARDQNLQMQLIQPETAHATSS